jgi:chromatin remodeling complex protein RSC6
MPPAPKKTASAPAKAAEPKVVEPKVVVEEPKVVAETPAEAAVQPTELAAAFAEFNTKLVAAKALQMSIQADFKALQKRSERELKAASKAGSKRKAKNAQRAPSGFVKPTLIRDDLAEFLGLAKGSMVARTEVTRSINAYIRQNKLQDPSNGRKINPDAKLKKLLSIKPTDELTYFNLQRYMSPFFIKAVATA